MSSKELNERIHNLDHSNVKPYVSCIGEKVIPYIGWYWRDVHFNTVGKYSLGVIPVGTKEVLSPTNTKPLVGFMENNKWGYPYVDLTRQEWSKLKALIIVAVMSIETKPLAKCTLAFKAVDDYMQSFADRAVRE